MQLRVSPVRTLSRPLRLLLALGLVALMAAPARAGEEELLSRGAVVDRARNSKKGINPSEVVTLADGETTGRAIFKPVAGSRHFTALQLMARLERGTLSRREAAASALAVALGVPYVPRTIERELDGRPGSLQLWVEDAERAADLAAPGRELDRAAAEMVRVFDYLIGQSDRTVRNLMVRRSGDKFLPVAIDNSNSFPRAPIPRFQWPHGWVKDQTGPLLPETRAFIERIDAAEVLAVLQRSGIERDAAVHLLRRLARLKRDPSFLEVPSGRAGWLRMQGRITRAGRSGTQGLPRAERAALDAMVIDAYGPARGKWGVIASTGLNAGIPGTGPNLSSEAGFSWRQDPATGRRRLILYGSGGGSVLFWGRKLVSSTLGGLRPQVERKVAAAGLSVARNHPIFGDRIAISPPFFSLYASRSGGLGFSIDLPPVFSVFGLGFPVARSVWSFYVSSPKLAGVSNRILDWSDRMAARVNRKLAPVKKRLAPLKERLAGRLAPARQRANAARTRLAARGGGRLPAAGQASARRTRVVSTAVRPGVKARSRARRVRGR